MELRLPPQEPGAEPVASEGCSPASDPTIITPTRRPKPSVQKRPPHLNPGVSRRVDPTEDLNFSMKKLASANAYSAPPPAQPNQSLIDGLFCLSVLAEMTRPLGVLELSRLLDMNRTRTNRLLKTLAHLGFAKQTKDRKYLVGPAMSILAAQSLMQLSQSQDLLRPLTALRSTGMTVAYGALWQRYVLYQYRADASEPTGPFIHISSERVYPATQSSIGQVLLAALPPSYVKALYRGIDIPGFPNTPSLTGLKALQETLTNVREQGYASLTAAQTEAKPSIAVPVGNPPFAAVALSGRATRKFPELLESLQKAARLIAEEDD